MLSACLLLPDIECRGPDCAVGGGCNEVSAWMEEAMNECVSGEEILGLLGRFKPLHLPLPTSRRSVWVLGAIVEIAARSVLDAGKQVALRHTTASQLDFGHFLLGWR